MNREDTRNYAMVKKHLGIYATLAKSLRYVLVFFQFYVALLLFGNSFRWKMYMSKRTVVNPMEDVVLGPILQISGRNMGFIHMIGREARRDPGNNRLIRIDEVTIGSSGFTCKAGEGYFDLDRNEIRLLDRPELFIKNPSSGSPPGL
ncbi:MAG: hypothetical protein LBB24_03560 [Rickettsiales bacterium]|jgi:hypothetical protein|nr:hypothetical protein [Rickettsiales bacterium]